MMEMACSGCRDDLWEGVNGVNGVAGGRDGEMERGWDLPTWGTQYWSVVKMACSGSGNDLWEGANGINGVVGCGV